MGLVNTVQIFKMAQISPAIVWSIVRNNHAYLMKRPNCRSFSKEDYNLKKLHSPKYNGFINPVGIDIVPNRENKGITICHKVGKTYFKPQKSYRRIPQRVSKREAFKNIRYLTKGQKVRGDLEMTALAAASTIIRSQERVAGTKPKRNHLLQVAKWRKRDARKKETNAKKNKKPKKAGKAKKGKKEAKPAKK